MMVTMLSSIKRHVKLFVKLIALYFLPVFSSVSSDVKICWLRVGNVQYYEWTRHDEAFGRDKISMFSAATKRECRITLI